MVCRAEFKRCGIMNFPAAGVNVVDSCRVFMREEPRSLKAALRYYCGLNHEGAHGALADSQAALDVLLAQVQR